MFSGLKSALPLPRAVSLTWPIFLDVQLIILTKESRSSHEQATKDVIKELGSHTLAIIQAG